LITMKTALIDYGAGNLSSVANALRAIGVDPLVTDSPAALATAGRVILPGVGSFGDCMAELEIRNLAGPLRDWLAAGRPYLGICLGYQILFDGSDESPGVRGLGAVAGHVRRFSDEPGLKIPHMGWNAAVPGNAASGIWDGLGGSPYFYFVHSYFPAPRDEGIIASRTTHGSQSFASAIERPNLLACQFHPEKSQDAGLALIRRFIEATPPSPTPPAS
jgi:imidazole glycerol phosphate synthase glutamine amidotransferase subunit